MLITKEIEIDMGHRVPNHKSKCRNIHGHRYKIEIGVDDKVISKKGASDEGMVIDFGDLKQIAMEKIDGGYDHGFIVYEKDEFIEFFKERRKEGMKVIVVPFIPTAENIARHFFNIMKSELFSKRIKLSHVKVWETPTSTALYTKENWKSDIR